MAKNHQQLAEQILPLVGGKENIRGVCHCQTRLRFTLVDGFLQGASGWTHPVFIFSELCTHTGAAQQPFPCSCPAAFPHRPSPPAG